MKIAVIGAGAVGGYFGGRLTQAGEDVTYIARSPHVLAIQANGLKVESVKGDFVVRPGITYDPKELGVVDVILVAVKAWQVPEAAKLITPLLGKDTIVVPLQNGVEAVGQLLDAVGASHVLGGFCRIISSVKAPGLICHAGAEPFVAIGELNGEISSRAQSLVDAFKRAGVSVNLSTEIVLDIWKKFLFIAAWSGVGAITRAPIGALRSYSGTRSMIEKAMLEIALVARASGVQLQDESVSVTMDYVDSLPPHVTASMQRDIMNKLPSELEAQTGAVVRLGRQYGLAVPVNTFIYDCLYVQESEVRKSVQ